MELLQLRYFTTVAKYQNISKAAAEYAIPQPAMSHTISKLEKELGKPLFERNSNRIVLNKDGREFYASVSKALCSLDDGVTGMRAASGTLNGEIKLLILQSRNLIIDLISDFTKLYPNIRFIIYHSWGAPQEQEFDFYLASEEFHIAGMREYLLFTEEVMLAVCNTHPLAQKKYVTVDDLRGERFVSMPKDSQLASVTEKSCGKYHVVPEKIIVCDDPFYVRKYVSLGMGVAFAPSVSWKGLWPENVELLHIDGDSFTRSTYLYMKDPRFVDEEHRVFRDYLITHLSNQ